MEASDEAARATAGARRDEMETRGKSCLSGDDGSDDADMENLFGDDDMESLFGSLDDDTEETSLASPTSVATPLPPPPALPLPTPITLPLPLPALPPSSAAAAPADWNSFCDVSTTLPESYHEEAEEDGQREGHEQSEQSEQSGQRPRPARQTTTAERLPEKQQGSGVLLYPDADPSGFDINLDLGDLEFDFNIDMSSFANSTGAGAAVHGSITTAAVSNADVGLDFDFGLGAAAELELARELGLELGAPQAETHATHETHETYETRNTQHTQHTQHTQETGEAGETQENQDNRGATHTPLDITVDTCFFDAAGLAGSPTSAYTAHTPQSVSGAGASTAADDVVVLYARPACPRLVSAPGSGHAETGSQPTTKTSAPPLLQLLSPASEPLSQPSSRHASEEASPAPTAVPALSTVPTTAPPMVPASLQASIPHYLELRPRCPQIPPPKRIDLGEFNVEELLPYVQLHSKLSMAGIQQMLGLNVDAGRLVVGECRRYLANPANRVAPSGSSDPAALRMLKVALIQRSLALLKYGEGGDSSPQHSASGVGERWFSRSSPLEPKSMHVWPDDSTTLVILFIQLLYRLTRNNSVRERQRKASALRRALHSPPRSPSPSDAGANTDTNTSTQTRKSAPRFAKEASAAKRPRLSPPDAYPFPHAPAQPPMASAASAAQRPQPILAYSSPRVLRDDLILSASRKPPPTAQLRYIVNVVDRSAQRLIPQVVLGHEGPIRSAGYSHLAQLCARRRGGQHVASVSIMTLLGLEKVGSDADWDRVVCRVHDDMLMDREVRVLVSVGEN